MGFFGEILGEIANAALDGMEKSMSESNLERFDRIGILFDYDYLPPFHIPAVRNNMVQGILVHIGNLIGIKVNQNNVNKNWLPFIDKSGSDGEMWDAFVLINETFSIKYGLYGMGKCALLIEGKDCGVLAKNIVPILENLDLNNIRYCFKEIPFNNAPWLELNERKLRKAKKESVSSEYFAEDGNPDLKIIDGQIETVTTVFAKFDDLFKKDFEKIFNTDSLYFSTEKINGTEFPVLTDNEVKIIFECGENYLEEDEGSIFINYIKAGKSFVFAFIVHEADVSILVSFTKEDATDQTFEALYPDPSFSFWEIIMHLEVFGAEISEDFSDNVRGFMQKLVDKTNVIISATQ